jgi:ribosomal protein L11 methyltransferase
MRWIEAKVFIDADDPESIVEIVSEIFRELETRGVAIDEPWVEPAEGWDAHALKPPDYYAVTGYFPENHRAEKRVGLLEEKITALKDTESANIRVVYKRIDEEDWSHSWKKYFKPQKVGSKIVIKPTWCDYEVEENEIVLEIDPGMAFGTGTHPTTANCIRFLEKYVKKGDSFLDVGVGSGILMLAAQLLGAGFMVGTDTDETAVEVAKNNLRKSGMKTVGPGLVVADLVSGLRGRFDVIAANILSDVIIRLVDSLADLMAEDGIFIASGIIEDNLDAVISKMEGNNLEVVEWVADQSWTALAARKKR